MFVEKRIRVAFLFLFCMLFVNAQIISPVLIPCSQEEQNIKISPEKGNEGIGAWYDYYNGDTEKNVFMLGFGQPMTYNLAICFSEAEGMLMGKTIKRVRFAIPDSKNIQDVKVWISNFAPGMPEESNKFFKVLTESELAGSNPFKEVALETPVKIEKRDLYVGYSFTVTACESDNDIYPILISKSGGEVTRMGTFLLNVGGAWIDYVGNNMGALTISVYAEDGEVKPGDVNSDGGVDVTDLASVVKYVLKENVTRFNSRAADIDNNDIIDIVDAASISDIIVGKYSSSTKTMNVENTDAIKACSTERGFDVSLSAENKYKAFQMDVILPAGTDFEIEPDALLAQTHEISYRRISDNKYRVVCYSVSSEEFADRSRLFGINTQSEDVKIENIVFATADLERVPFADVCNSDVTGILNVNTEDNVGDIYTIDGYRINRSVKSLDKGLYIIKGKKIIVK